jgi:hypothetical protein
MGDGFDRYPYKWMGRSVEERITQRVINGLLKTSLREAIENLPPTEKQQLVDEWETGIREELESLREAVSQLIPAQETFPGRGSADDP